MRRFVFLDFDGVITSREHSRWYFAQRSRKPGEYFDPECITRVDRLCAAARAQVVLSTSWKAGMEPPGDPEKDEWLPIPGKLDELRNRLIEAGLKAPVVAATPMLPTHIRGREIALWMSRNEVSKEQVVVLDDFPGRVMKPLASRLVRTRTHQGFTESDLRKALRLFGVSLPA